MLDTVYAVRFDGRVKSGKTRPYIFTCERNDGTEVEVVAKFSAGCERKMGSLVAEAIAAMLAADLDLPVPEPLVVQLDSELVDAIPDQEVRSLIGASSPVAFGSKKLVGFTTWPTGGPLPKALVQTAAEIFAFDALIQNSDRRPDNPNCLVKGTEFAILDHELAFVREIGWRPPWEAGALESWARPGVHLFGEQLAGKAPDLGRFAGAWEAISDERLAQYRGSLPTEWVHEDQLTVSILGYLSQVRDNVQAAIEEVWRVLR